MRKAPLSKRQAAVIRTYKEGYRADANGIVRNKFGVAAPTDQSTWKTTLYTRFRRVKGSPRDLEYRFPIPVHLLVAYQKYGLRAFGPGICIRHKDNQSLNNRPPNIQIGTLADNSQDRPPAERQHYAQNAANAQRRFTDAEVRHLREDRARGATYRELARKWGCTISTISYIVGTHAKRRGNY